MLEFICPIYTTNSMRGYWRLWRVGDLNRFFFDDFVEYNLQIIRKYTGFLNPKAMFFRIKARY